VERLGKEFFGSIPAQPGVYSMRNASDDVLYVGKAKNLRQRLRSYRVANPDRMRRRHLRLLREVTRIDFDLCSNESAALVREARLLRRLRPRFNRAGVWPAKAQFLTWRFAEGAAQISVSEIPPLGWQRFGSLGGYAIQLLGPLVRLLWTGLNPPARFTRLPHGWARNRFALPVTLRCGPRHEEIRELLDQLFFGDAQKFSAWLLASIGAELCPFERAALQLDLDEIENFAAAYRQETTGRPIQLPLL